MRHQIGEEHIYLLYWLAKTGTATEKWDKNTYIIYVD